MDENVLVLELKPETGILSATLVVIVLAGMNDTGSETLARPPTTGVELPVASVDAVMIRELVKAALLPGVTWSGTTATL